MTEELEELNPAKAVLLNSLDCTDDTDVSTVREEIVALESGLKKLEEQLAGKHLKPIYELLHHSSSNAPV